MAHCCADSLFTMLAEQINKIVTKSLLIVIQVLLITFIFCAIFHAFKCAIFSIILLICGILCYKDNNKLINIATFFITFLFIKYF